MECTYTVSSFPPLRTVTFQHAEPHLCPRRPKKPKWVPPQKGGFTTCTLISFSPSYNNTRVPLTRLERPPPRRFGPRVHVANKRNGSCYALAWLHAPRPTHSPRRADVRGVGAPDHVAVHRAAASACPTPLGCMLHERRDTILLSSCWQRAAWLPLSRRRVPVSRCYRPGCFAEPLSLHSCARSAPPCGPCSP